MESVRAECGMRALSLVFAAMAALLVGLNSETETVLLISKKATVKDLSALWAMTIAASATAGYHLLQLCRCLAFAALGQSPIPQNKSAAWLQFLLDQGITYVIFVATMAGFQGSMVALLGVHKLQWAKLCSIYGRFCKQIAGGVLCGLGAFLAMSVVSAISARRLFRLR